MKTIIGVDANEVYVPAMALIDHLQFPDNEVILAYSVEALAFLSPHSIEPGEGEDFEGIEVGKQYLKKAMDRAGTHSMQAKSELLSGGPAIALVELADRIHADLIAVQTKPKHGLLERLLGSTSRGLATSAHQSVLISKGMAVSGKLRVVFATDHSEYANKALELFIQWAPKGIENVHVVHAVNDDIVVPGDKETAIQAMVDSAKEENEQLVQKLQGAGFTAESSVHRGVADEVIKTTINSTESELLVMGAQGHGFAHRFFIGSTSLNQVLAEQYPVLLLRPKMS